MAAQAEGRVLLEWGDGWGTFAPADDALLSCARQGDAAAFALLYDRHVGMALQWARSYSADEQTVRDLVTESFARVLGAVRRGRGPTRVFWLYLAATMRSIAYERSVHGQQVRPAADWEPFAAAARAYRPDANPECALTLRAFSSLPPRWQFVLWRTDVEGEPAASVAMDLGLSPAVTGTLVRRAREGMRGAYLEAQLRAGLLRQYRRQARRFAAGTRWFAAGTRWFAACACRFLASGFFVGAWAGVGGIAVIGSAVAATVAILALTTASAPATADHPAVQRASAPAHRPGGPEVMTPGHGRRVGRTGVHAPGKGQVNSDHGPGQKPGATRGKSASRTHGRRTQERPTRGRRAATARPRDPAPKRGVARARPSTRHPS
jgi:DNA-directed RNA polymerase specialized sigma24 family protein